MTYRSSYSTVGCYMHKEPINDVKMIFVTIHTTKKDMRRFVAGWDSGDENENMYSWSWNCHLETRIRDAKIRASAAHKYPIFWYSTATCLSPSMTISSALRLWKIGNSIRDNIDISDHLF